LKGGGRVVKLNKNQAQAVAHIDGPCMVLAGPGSGKTRIISQRIVSMVLDHDIPPTRILAISFTKASSLEMKKRTLAYGKDDRLNKVSFGTFHSSFFRILRRYAGVSLEDLLLDLDRFKLVRSILKYLKISNYNDDDVLDLLNEISLVKNELVDYRDYDSQSFEQEIFQKAYRLYEDEKKRHGKIDFDDMLIQAYDLLNNDPAILSIVRQVFKYILIDEFQDINRVQFELIRLIAGQENNLFVVGDEDQSIYGFRGARPDFMLEFDQYFPSARHILLDTNYRSSKDIVDLSLGLIKKNKKRHPKDLKAFNNVIKSNILERADFIKNPVEIKEEKMYKVANYGSSMAPFYSVLAAWGGVIILSTILSTEPSKEYRSIDRYFGRLSFFLILSIIQSMIISTGDLFILGVTAKEPVLFILILMLCSMAFCVLIFTLVSCFNTLGKGIAMFLLVIQIGGSGGTFPVQMTPTFFRTINSVIPFTYGINACREAIGGVYMPNLVNDIGALLVFALIPLVFGVMFKEKINDRMEPLSEKFEKSFLIH